MNLIIYPWHFYDLINIFWARAAWENSNSKLKYVGEIRVTLEPDLDNLYFIIYFSTIFLENNYGKLYPNCKKRFESLTLIRKKSPCFSKGMNYVYE